MVWTALSIKGANTTDAPGKLSHFQPTNQIIETYRGSLRGAATLSGELRVKITPFKTLIRAVSVIWWTPKPDKMQTLWIVKKDCSWLKSVFSNTSDKKAILRWSRFGFLIKGCTTGCLNAVGKQPELRRVFIRAGISDPTEIKPPLEGERGSYLCST